MNNEEKNIDEIKNNRTLDSLKTNIFTRFLLSIWVILTDTYPNPIHFIHRITQYVSEETKGQQLKQRIRFHYEQVSENDCGQVTLIADYQLSGEYEPNTANFNMYRNKLYDTLSEFLSGNVQHGDEIFYPTSTTAEALFKKNLRVPVWFLLSIAGSSGCKGEGDYFEDIYAALAWVNEQVMRVPTGSTIHLDAHLDDKIKLAANIRKVNNLRKRIECLRTNQLKLIASGQNNTRVAEVAKEIEFTEKRMRELTNVISRAPLLAIPSLSPKVEEIDDEIIEVLPFDENGNIIYPEDSIKAIPSMMMPNEVDTVTDKAENVIIETSLAENKGDVLLSEDFRSLAEKIMTDGHHDFKSITDRWIEFDTIELSPVVRAKDILATIHLPYDMVKKNWKSPNALPFKQFGYFSGGMTIKALWNVNKTNQIAIQGGIVYHALQRDRPTELQNIHTVSQQPGFVLNGHANSSSETHIPFDSFMPIIPIRQNGNVANLYYATLTIVALTSFQVADGANDRTTLTIHGKFDDDLKFYGMQEAITQFPSNAIFGHYHKGQKKSHLHDAHKEYIIRAKPSMMKAAAVAGVAAGVTKGITSGIGETSDRVVGKVLDKFLPKKDTRMSHTKEDSRENVVVHQRTTPNMASGMGHNTSETFRLNASSETSHNEVFFGDDKVRSLEDIMNTYGIVSSFNIRMTDVIGTKLFAAKIQPGQYEPFIMGSSLGNNMENWAPVDHLAGWFLNFCGKMDFRFMAVSDGFKTFRLRIVYTQDQHNVTYTDSLSMYCTIINIEPSLDSALVSATDSLFITPYLTIPIARPDGTANFIGSMHVFVETAISAPAGSYDNVDIIVYKRATRGSKFSVPSPNRSSISYTDPLVSGQLTLELSSTWKMTVIIDTVQIAFNIDESNIYRVNVTGLNFVSTRDGTYVSNDGFLELVILRGTMDATVFINFRNAVYQIFLKPITSYGLGLYWLGTPGLSADVRKSTEKKKHGDYEKVATQTLIDNKRQVMRVRKVRETEVDPNAIMAHPSMMTDNTDARFCDPHKTSTTKEAEPIDAFIHGEDHMDLGMVLRRKEYWYATPVLSMDNSKSFERFFSMPCNFGTPLVREQTLPLWRFNKITHLHDAFRYSRGSISYTFVASCEKADGTIMVQHRPQDDILPLNGTDQFIRVNYDGSGFGENVWSLSQNTAFSIDVPMYVPQRGILNAAYLSDEYSINVAKSLGVVNFYYAGPQNQISIDVWRSFGNDTSMFCFNGFPLRKATGDTHSVNLNTPTPHILPAYASMFSSTRRAVENLGSIKPELINGAFQSVEKMATALESTIMKGKDFLTNLGNSECDSHLYGTLAIQLAQVVNNPKPITAALAVAQVLLNTGIFKNLSLEVLQDKMMKIFMKQNETELYENGADYAFDVDFAGETSRIRATASNIPFVEEMGDLCGTIVCAIASYFSVPAKFPFSERISLAFIKNASWYERVLEFTKKIINFILRCARFCVQYFFPECKLFEWLEDNTITEWLEDSAVMIDPSVQENVKQDFKAIACLYWLVKQGRDIELKLASCKKPSGVLTTVRDRLKSLVKLQEHIAGACNNAPVKFNPFVLYMAGKSQIGKSHLCQVLASMLEEDMPQVNRRVIPKTSPYVVTVGKFWDLYANNDVVFFDDFNRNTNQPDTTQTDIAYLLDLKGPATFVVPKADITSKGMKSNAHLVLCASNYLYPTQNGVIGPVVWARRDSVWWVTRADIKACTNHATQKVGVLTCPDCKNLDGNREALATFSHLSFSKCSIDNDYNDKATYDDCQNLTFQEFLRVVKQEMKVYYAGEMENYKQRLVSLGINMEHGDVMLPVDPFEKMHKMMNRECVNNIIDGLGGRASQFRATPAGSYMYGFNPMSILYDWLNPKHGVIDADDGDLENIEPTPKYPGLNECVHNIAWEGILDGMPDELLGADPKELRETFNYKRIRFDNRGHELYVDAEDGGYWVRGSRKCCDTCNYYDNGYPYTYIKRMTQYTDIIEKIGIAIPSNYPIRFLSPRNANTLKALREHLAKQEKVAGYLHFKEKCLTILTAIAGMATAYGLLYMAERMSLNRMESIKDGFKEIEKRQEEKLAKTDDIIDVLPSMYFTAATKNESGSSSGQILKKIHARRQMKMSARVMKAKASMSLDTVFDRYKQNTVEIFYKDKHLVSALCTSMGTYYTQHHAMLNLIYHWTTNFEADLKANPLIETAVGQEKDSLLELLHNRHKLIFKRTVSESTVQSIEITMQEFLKMNNWSVLFCGDEDRCIFTFKHANLNTKGMYNDIYSEADTLTQSNFSVMRYRMGQWSDVQEAKGCRDEEQNIHYYKEGTPWGKDDRYGNGIFRCVGFSVENIYGNDAATMCGSVLIDNTTGKICGIQSAITDARIYFNSLCQEQLIYWGTLHPQEGILKARVSGASLVEGEEVFNICPPQKLYHAVKSPFLHSAIHGELSEVVKVPANIEVDKDHGIGSFKRAISQYVPHHDFDFELAPIYEDLEMQFLNMRTDLDFKSVRSDKEAVSGIEGLVKGIDMNTSAGIPWALTKELKSKKKLLIHDEDNNFVGYEKQFAYHLKEEMEAMEKGQEVKTIFQISHKPELLKNPDKVRIIQGSPLTYTIHMRKYFMDFNYAFQFDRVNQQHRVGMNVYSEEWNDLALRLLKKGTKILVGDFSKFGPRLYTPFVNKSYDIMRAWYRQQGCSEKDDFIREQLSKRAVNCLNMAYNEVFRLRCGSPSGAINTAIVNSMCNMMYFRAAWLGIMKEKCPEKATMHDFKENVELIVYGDDVIASVSEEFIELFNNTTIHEFFAQYDIKYTDIIKDGAIRPYCSLEESTFLQEGFHRFNDTSLPAGLWICKPVKENIQNIINWIRKPKGIGIIEAKKKEELIALKVNCETAIRLHWFLGRREFEEFQNKVRARMLTFDSEFMPTRYTFAGLQQELGIPERKINDKTRSNIIREASRMCSPAKLTAYVFYENNILRPEFVTDMTEYGL